MTRTKLVEGKKDHVLTLRLNDKEYGQVKARSEADSVPMATILRSYALKWLKRTQTIEAAADPVVRLSAKGSSKVKRARSKLEKNI
jgi:hypothetical protein